MKKNESSAISAPGKKVATTCKLEYNVKEGHFLYQTKKIKDSFGWVTLSSRISINTCIEFTAFMEEKHGGKTQTLEIVKAELKAFLLT